MRLSSNAVEQHIQSAACMEHHTRTRKVIGTSQENREPAVACVASGAIEPVPNRLQRLRMSDNDKHRKMCEGCLKIKNHGMTYEQALNFAGIPTEEVE